MIRLRAERPRNCVSIPGMDKRLIRLQVSKLNVGPTFLSIQRVPWGVKRPGDEANHLPVTSDEFRNESNVILFCHVS
jgi:hypothetical protein